jgi:hypothetical protein
MSYTREPCSLCKQSSTPEGHDPCIARLPGVRNACCGHGDPELAYVQLQDWSSLQGWDALEWMRLTLRAARRDPLEWLELNGVERPHLKSLPEHEGT